MMAKHKLVVTVAVALVVTVLALTVERGTDTSEVQAAELLAEASTYGLDTHGLSDSQVLTYQTNVWQRLNPDRGTLADPYHLPVTELVAESYQIQHWLRGGNTWQWRSTARHPESERVIYDWVREGATVYLYDGSRGRGVRYTEPAPRASASEEPFLTDMAIALEQALTVQGVVESAWGQPAWHLQLREPAKPMMAATGTVPPYSQTPYLADLDVQEIQQSWLIDQATHRLVSYERLALTPTGPVRLETRENTPPIVLPFKQLPTDWLAYPLEEDKPVVALQGTLNEERSQPQAATIGLEEVGRYLTFAPLLPVPAPQARQLAFFSSEPATSLAESGYFDIQNAAAQGLALEVLYLPDHVGNAYQLVQGDSATLAPLLTQAPPIWRESRPVPIMVEGEAIQGWLLGGGRLNSQEYSQQAIIFEQKGTLVFVLAQGYDEAHLLDFVGFLQRES